ncbi:MAG: HAD-IB family hydrolase [Saprospiraceae bacterium]|nr:haloacid dehalogenase-like hydrolase [Lewinellaceae bacterium]
MKPKTLVLFDFDGTLSKRDSLLPFILFSVKPMNLILKAAIWSFRLFGLLLRGKLNKERAKEALMASLYKGLTKAQLNELGSRFFAVKSKDLMYPDMMQIMHQYKTDGATVAIVSAAVDIWLEAFCVQQKVALICTQTAFDGEYFTGKFAGPNCNNEEKVRRIKERFSLDQFDHIIAYGNTKGDWPMLGLAHESWYMQSDGLSKFNRNLN